MFTIFSQSVCIAQDEVIESSVTIPSQNNDTKNLRSAMGELNYKIEYMQDRYNALERDLEDLRKADKEQRKMISEQSLQRGSNDRLKNLETESDLLRADLAQIKEDMGLMKPRANNQNIDNEGQPWYSWPYLPAISVVISLIALIAR